jgi:hypothetical protein
LSIDLGSFELSLDVADISSSFDFYTRLGFRKVGGSVKDGWVIMEYQRLRIGLYRGHIEGNLFNFRGGDIHRIARHMQEMGIELQTGGVSETDEMITMSLEDPDGNSIYFARTKEKWVSPLNCPRCEETSEPTGKGFDFGVFEAREYFCENCEKTFNAFYKEKELSHTVPKSR